MPHALLALLLAPGPAAAHYPHDAATWVAEAPVATEGAEPAWVATSLWRTDAWMVVRSPDRLDIETHYLLPGTEENFCTAGAFATAERLFLATLAGGLLRSEDGGASWSVHPDHDGSEALLDLVASPEVLDDGLLFLLSETAVHRSSDGGETWTATTFGGAPLVDLDLSADFLLDQTLCVVDEAGALSCSHDAGVSFEEPVETGVSYPWQLAVDGPGRVFLGHDAGLVRCELLDAGACSPTTFSERAALVATTSTGSLFVATEDEALFRSEDLGSTWVKVGRELEATQPGQGGLRAEEHYFELVETAGGRLWLAAWEGLAWSEDDGETWTRLPTARQETVRSVSLSRGEQGLVALLATYGGGALLTDVEAGSAEQISLSAPKRYLRHLATTPHWGRDGFAAIVGGGTAELTADWGDTWAEAEAGVGSVQRGATSPDLEAEPSLLLLGTQGGGLAVSRSEDLGETWAAASLSPACGAAPSALAVASGWVDRGLAWAACEAPGIVYQTEDHGLSWSVLDRRDETVHAVAGVAGGPVFVATPSGLHRYEAGEHVHTALAGGAVQHVVVGPDWTEEPVVYAVTADGGWWRSEDGGEDFTALPAPDAGYPLWIALSPDFTEDRSLAVSGYGGAWSSRDGGETWADLRRLAWLEEDSQWLVYSGDWSRRLEDSASGGWLTEGLAGAAVDLRLEGVGFRLRAAGAGRLQVAAEAAAVVVDLDSTEPGVVYEEADLGPGWHARTLTVLEGTVALDAVEVDLQAPADGGWDSGVDGPGGEAEGGGADDGGLGEPEVDPGRDDARRCGCGDGRAAVLLLPLLLLVRREEG